MAKLNKKELLDQQIKEVEDAKHELTIQKNKLDKSFAFYQTQLVIGQILKDVSGKGQSIEQFLQTSLDKILKTPWFKIKEQGAVFLEENGNLRMVAQKNIEEAVKTCKIIKPGQCLCGKVLQDKKMIFSEQVDHLHDISYVGMTKHGHYAVPIKMDEEILGVLNIYLEQNHTKNFDEIEFLETVCDTFASVISRKKAFIEIEKYSKETEKQKIIAESALKHVSDSINYAKSIQNSLLPGEDELKVVLPSDYFVFAKPKDVVSGDFYFVKKINKYSIFAVADCTGHGVPGALITMLGMTFLNDIVIDKNIISTGEVLNRMRHKIKDTFKSYGDNIENKNGLDIVLCVVNTETNVLQYSGAFNPLYIYRNKELIELKATRNPIGYYPVEKDFEQHDIQLENGDYLYLFSDGYVDQQGGERGKKFSKRQFKELLGEIHKLPSIEQKEIFEGIMNKWMGNLSQVDDMAIMGMKWEF